MKTLLGITALIEAATGAGLLVSPPLVAELLLGASLAPAPALIVGRVAGAALLALGIACWFGREDGASRAAHGLVFSMLVYNTVTTVVLTYSGMTLRLAGLLLWPAVALHAALVVWCAVCLWHRAVARV